MVSGTAKFHLRTLRSRTSPSCPRPAARRIRVPSQAFVETIGRVARSASRDETRPHLTGVLVSASGQELRMVATDSYRLSVKETSLEQALDGELEANVPARTLQELAGSPGREADGEIEIAALEHQVVFTVGDTVLSSRLVEGRFPNYRQLLPETFEHELRLSTAELLEVVRRISLLAQKNAPLRMALQRGHARGLGADARRGRGERVAARAVQGRAARDRLQPGVPARRARERGVRGARAEADQPAAARA